MVEILYYKYIENLFRDLDNQNLSHATQLKCKDILNQMFKKALNNNDVPKNVVSIHSNTSDEIIRKYYSSKSQYQMSLDHSKLFPESNDFIQKLEKQTTKNQNKKSEK